jgi:hypothetical protein
VKDERNVDERGEVKKELAHYRASARSDPDDEGMLIGTVEFSLRRKQSHDICQRDVQMASDQKSCSNGGRPARRTMDGRTDTTEQSLIKKEQERERTRTEAAAAAAKQTKIASSGRLSGLVYLLLAPFDLALPYTSPSFTTCYYYNYYCCYHYYCHPQMEGYTTTLGTLLRWMRHGIIQTRGTSGRLQFASFDLIV